MLQAATLLHHWPLNEGGGTNAADVVGSAPMRLWGTGATNGWRTLGRVGGAYEFSGSTYFLTYSNNAISDPGAAVAIAGWFKAAPDVGSRDYLYEFERVFGMRIRNGSLQVSFNDDTSSAPQWGSGYDDGEWYHFVAQNTNGTTTLYVNGAWVGSYTETLASLTSVSRPSALGSRQSVASLLDGWLDDVRFYSGGLSEQEIQALALVVNQPPTAQEDAYAGNLNTPIVVAAPGVLANDSDVDNDPLTAVLVSNVTQGVLSLSTNGAFTYTPPVGFSGQQFFQYYAVDKDGTSGVALVTLTILDPNTSLTTAEVAKIESDLGITMTEQQKLDLAAIVKTQAHPAWRVDAQNRINAHRKANLTVEVVDSQTNPVQGASVRILMTNHLFRFGGAVTVMDLTDASGSLSTAGSTATQWQQIVKSLFNSVGADNAFKSKITSQHIYLPGFIGWAASNNLPVRGHLLMWPGVGTTNDLDDPLAVPGVDYGDHLSNASLSPYKSYNVLGAVTSYWAGARGPADKAALKAVVDAEITQWAGNWNVYEWDVINETLGNTLLQELLGYQEMAEWFKIAATNRVNPNANLLINEFQIVSARFDDGSASYNSRRNTYYSRIDSVITNGGPITGIGFQSRYVFGHIDPALVYSRLQEFASRYPALRFVGTEFEMKDRYNSGGTLLYKYDETTRAQMTEELMTMYFSHPQVDGLIAWDFMNPPASEAPGATEDEKQYTRSMFYYGDGPGGITGPVAKLNGLVWYYLHRLRFHTDASGNTGANGTFLANAFKGDYSVQVSYQGTNQPVAVYRLTSNGTFRFVLGGVTVTNPPPVIRERVIDHWPFDDAPGVQLKDTTNLIGTTKFTNATPAAATDGTNYLIITQHPTATNQSSGYAIYSGPLSMGPRTKGRFELDVVIAAVNLTGGDASGSSIGFGLRDSASAADLFRIRLNKTASGLAVNTFYDNTYTAISNFTGQYILAEPIRMRSVLDLDARTADIYLTVGAGPEFFKQQLPLATNAPNPWDKLSFVAVNNKTDWGLGDTVIVDYIRLRKVDIERYSDWATNTIWGGYTERAEDDDPENDGLPNMIEYALGGNPSLDDAATLGPTLLSTTLGPAYAFVLGRDTLDLPVRVEHSSDLFSWNQIAPTLINGQPGDSIQILLTDPENPMRASRFSVGP